MWRIWSLFDHLAGPQILPFYSHRGGFEYYAFWELGPSYRFDLLGYEIPWIADELAYAIAYMSIYLPHIKQDVSTRHELPSIADFLYWYHTDAGIRIASSCWERLGLLMDLAFDLNLRHKCSFPRALDGLASHEVAESEQYKLLDKIRNEEFQQLESGHGRGMRHETTHYLNPRTRFLHMQLIEQWDLDVSDADDSEDANYWLKFLVEQHKLYVNGATAAIDLVARHSG
ncbi:MAG: Cthe_2314 family HEPN domain-containing protein [Thermoleophilia bacterium]